MRRWLNRAVAQPDSEARDIAGRWKSVYLLGCRPAALASHPLVPSIHNPYGPPGAANEAPGTRLQRHQLSALGNAQHDPPGPGRAPVRHPPHCCCAGFIELQCHVRQSLLLQARVCTTTYRTHRSWSRVWRSRALAASAAYESPSRADACLRALVCLGCPSHLRVSCWPPGMVVKTVTVTQERSCRAPEGARKPSCGAKREEISEIPKNVVSSALAVVPPPRVACFLRDGAELVTVVLVYSPIQYL